MGSSWLEESSDRLHTLRICKKNSEHMTDSQLVSHFSLQFLLMVETGQQSGKEVAAMFASFRCTHANVIPSSAQGHELDWRWLKGIVGIAWNGPFSHNRTRHHVPLSCMTIHRKHLWSASRALVSCYPLLALPWWASVEVHASAKFQSPVQSHCLGNCF